MSKICFMINLWVDLFSDTGLFQLWWTVSHLTHNVAQLPADNGARGIHFYPRESQEEML